MTEQEILDKVIKTAYTKRDLHRRLRFLREYLEEGYFLNQKSDLTKFLLKKHATTDDIEAFLTYGDDLLKEFQKDNMYKILNTIGTMIKSIAFVSLYIPYEPVPAEIIKLGKWFRDNVSGKILLDIRTDVTLLGGCAFAYRGVYRDYSLRYYIQKKRDEITKIITEYVEKFYTT